MHVQKMKIGYGEVTEVRRATESKGQKKDAGATGCQAWGVIASVVGTGWKPGTNKYKFSPTSARGFQRLTMSSSFVISSPTVLRSLVMDVIRFFYAFLYKNFQGLLAVECKFWKSRTAPVHEVRDHRVTTGVTSPASVHHPSNEWAEPFAHNFEGGSQVVRCCSVLNISLPALKSSRRGSLCHRPWSCTTQCQRGNAPARCIPGPACWVNAHMCCVSASANSTLVVLQPPPADA